MILEEKANHTLSFNEFEEKAVQDSLFRSAHHHQLPIAAWRLPKQQQQHVIIDLSGQAREVPLELENMEAGFVVSPFINKTNPLQARFIQADIHYCTDWTQPKVNEQKGRDLKVQAEQFFHTVHHHLKNQGDKESEYHLPIEPPVCRGSDKASFIAMVKKAISSIEETQFQKIVPSRRKLIKLPDHFDIVQTFRRLCDAYPAAFISVFSIPDIGTWVGASPEILVNTYPEGETKMFRTIALAGTQVKKGNKSLRETAWKQKEIEEQALVGRYIISCFKKIRLREFDELGPKTVAAGHLLHLRTDYTVDMIKTNFTELATTMLQLLHPTSAVCGMPKEPTMDFLQQEETYDREFFSGFIGPVNIVPDELHIFVNLRCMQLLDRQAILYSGAGVTIDSDPEKEWKETEAKMNTLLKVVLN